MSTVAKIFVVVNLLLGVVAFGSAATLLGAQDDYKSALESVNTKFDEYKDARNREVNDLTAQLNTQNNRASQAVADRNRFETQVADLTNRLAEAQRINQNNLSTIETLTKEIQASNKINQDNKDWLDRISAESKKSTDDANKSRRALDDESATASSWSSRSPT
jgi:gas vesicle protein